MDTGDIQQSLPHWSFYTYCPTNPQSGELSWTNGSQTWVCIRITWKAYKMLLLIPTLTDSAGLGWALRISISNKYPGDAGLGTTLEISVIGQS